MSRPKDKRDGATGRPVGIKDIARALGTSIGTVDRALHGRAGINAETREKVLKAAREMGYRPNLAARSLKVQKRIRVAAILPAEIASFFQPVGQGIAEAARLAGPSLELEMHTHPRLGEGDAELFAAVLETAPGGIVIAPGNPSAMRPLIDRAARQRVAVVCVATDAPGSERLAAVTIDAHSSGAMAGELLTRIVRERGAVAVVTGDLSTEDHVGKLRGFQASLRAFGSGLALAEVIEAHDDEREAYTRTLALVRGAPDLRALYVSTANSLPVLQALRESGRGDGIAVITTDLFPALAPHLREGRVVATLYQRPFTQGRLAFQQLWEYLAEGRKPPAATSVLPHLAMRSNLEALLERVQSDGDETGVGEEKARKAG